MSALQLVSTLQPSASACQHFSASAWLGSGSLSFCPAVDRVPYRLPGSMAACWRLAGRRRAEMRGLGKGWPFPNPLSDPAHKQGVSEEEQDDLRDGDRGEGGEVGQPGGDGEHDPDAGR